MAPPAPSALGALNPPQRHQLPFYGHEPDVPEGGSRTLAGRAVPFKSRAVSALKEFRPEAGLLSGRMPSLAERPLPPHAVARPRGFTVFRPAAEPPSPRRTARWLAAQSAEEAPAQPAASPPPPRRAVAAQARVTPARSQVDGPSPANTFNFKMKTQHVTNSSFADAVQHLTCLSMELHAESRGKKLSDPAQDAIRAIYYVVREDGRFADGGDDLRGIVMWRRPGEPRLPLAGCVGFEVDEAASEVDLIRRFVRVVKRWDPDMLVGYEIQLSSWGYLLQRGQALQLDINALVSRIPAQATDAPKEDNVQSEYAARHTSELRVPGRVILNVWRLMRKELSLTSYSYESVAFHILHKRVPTYLSTTLRAWYDGDAGSSSQRRRWLVTRHYMDRAAGCLHLLHELSVINNTSEFARIFGILFNEVLARGSQFRVESIMIRIARPMGFTMLSPTREQVRGQAAPEAVPLILEPQSEFYTDPVLVLDFQSLYPSMMIAYNMCYSTCLGKVPRVVAKAAPGGDETAAAGARPADPPAEGQAPAEGPELRRDPSLGCAQLLLRPGLLSRVHAGGGLHIAPNGVVFCRREERRGVLPRMLEEILRTRVMVKQAMKKAGGDATAARLLNARQLGLKLIANVTYGYTSATFSGRMPCVHIADSIVQQGRETLAKAIREVERKWAGDGARVVYGDTDSMFVKLPGATREDAFRIGKAMAAHITAINPDPVKLKFEKVYLPCILQTKKRYVGHMWETEADTRPVFEAKGIETVRRDGCPAVGKMLEKSLCLLFTTKDLSLVKRYLCEQWTKILAGRVNVRDFIIAKEYRGRASYSAKACVASLEIANKLTRLDPRAEPRVRERVPYVIVCGPPQSTLLSLVRQPHELLNDPSMRLYATYYIRKQIIPPLERCFRLLGVSVVSWYDRMPKPIRVHNEGAMQGGAAADRRTTITHFYQSRHCVVCETVTTGSTLCPRCLSDPQRTSVIASGRLRSLEQRLLTLHRICHKCAASREEVQCVSVLCPVRYERVRLNGSAQALSPLRALPFGSPSW